MHAPSHRICNKCRKCHHTNQRTKEWVQCTHKCHPGLECRCLHLLVCRCLVCNSNGLECLNSRVCLNRFLGCLRRGILVCPCLLNICALKCSNFHSVVAHPTEEVKEEEEHAAEETTYQEVLSQMRNN